MTQAKMRSSHLRIWVFTSIQLPGSWPSPSVFAARESQGVLPPVTRGSTLLCQILPSILQWRSAINTPQVGSCHDALALKGADSVTAGELRAPSRPAPATCSGSSHLLCQDPGWREASGIPWCPCPPWTAGCTAACLVKAGQKPLPATCLPPYGGPLKTRHFHKETLELFVHQMQF